MLSLTGLAQEKKGAPKDTLIKKLDSLNKKTDSAGKQINNISPGAYNETTKLNFRNYFILLGSDLKQSFTKPFHMNHKDWGKFGKFALVTGALAFGDEPIQQSVQNLTNNNPGILNVSKYVTNFGGLYEVYTLGGLEAYGLIFKNQKMKTTTLLATQAYLTGGILESFLKVLSGFSSFYPVFLLWRRSHTLPLAVVMAWGNTDTLKRMLLLFHALKEILITILLI